MNQSLARPIFILGIAPRSGTNLVRELILLHPDCCGANVVGEDFLVKHSDILFNYVSEVYKSWSDYWRWNGTSKEEQRERLLCLLSKSLASYLKPEGEFKRFLSVTPYTENIGNIFRLFPEAKVLVVIRNGKDVVESGVLGGFWNYEDGFLVWKQSAERISKLDDIDLVTRNNCRIIRFEELIINQEEFVADLLKWLELEVSHYPFDQINDLPVFGSSTNRKDGKFEWKRTKKTNDFSPLGRSKNWSKKLHYRFEWVCGSVERDLGYESTKISRSVRYYRVNFFQNLKTAILRIRKLVVMIFKVIKDEYS